MSINAPVERKTKNTNYKAPYSAPAGRDLEITRLAVEEHLDQTAIAKRFDIGPARVGQILTKTTHRTQVLRFLLDRKDQRFTSKEIAQELRVDINKVQYVVDALAKRGRASFKKRTSQETGDHLAMYDVHLNEMGLKEARSAARLKTVRYDPSKPNPEIQAAARAMAVKPAPPAPPKIEYDERDPRRNGAAHAQIAPAPVAPASQPPVAPVPVVDVLPVETAHVELGIAEIPRFPLIAQLTTRNEKLQAAAKLVESAGQYDDLALTILQRLDDFTPLEKEVLAYVDLHGIEATR